MPAALALPGVTTLGQGQVLDQPHPQIRVTAALTPKGTRDHQEEIITGGCSAGGGRDHGRDTSVPCPCPRLLQPQPSLALDTARAALGT